MNIILKNAIKIITINSFSPLKLRISLFFTSQLSRMYENIFAKRKEKKSPFSMKLTNPKVSR